MTKEFRFEPLETGNAAAIQRVIDAMGPKGGRVVLPKATLLLDRGIELRSNIELSGSGPNTILRPAPSRIYSLSGYHNYGMFDVPLTDTTELEPGMTVTIREEANAGFYETFACITWVEEGWVGIDTGLHADLQASKKPELITSFPLVFSRSAENISLSNLSLDGQRDKQVAGIGNCRGAAAYFISSRSIEVKDVNECDFAGEGLGFQMCADIAIRGCRFDGNAGNGYHPGAGSTGAEFSECTASGNDGAGFFFCVRANHITVGNCGFEGNGTGVSIGTRDCYNRISGCRISANKGPGILLRKKSIPGEAHSCLIEQCTISENAGVSGNAQIDILPDAHSLCFVANKIQGSSTRPGAGIFADDGVSALYIRGSRFQGCANDFVVPSGAIVETCPDFECGRESAKAKDFRHLNFQYSPDSNS